MSNFIDAKTLKEMIISAANNIENQKQPVNELNVFPVPDGDTGTNMSLTMGAAKAELLKQDFSTVDEVSKLVANAMLRGARGNSGVILSLLFRGFAKAMAGLKTATPKNISEGFAAGVENAYRAVMKPTEGTILTVSRVAAEQSIALCRECADVNEFFKKVIDVAEDTLKKTPDMLPVLKQANVVDAGGKGYIVILEGMYSYLQTGNRVEASGATETSEKADFASFDASDIKFGYCTEFIVQKDKKPKKSATALRAYLESMGDSVVVVDDEEIIKCHVHTNNPGKALEEALKCGALFNMKIENMLEQQKEMAAESESKKNADVEVCEPVPAEKKYGFVSVCAGEGIGEVFLNLGVDMLVSGGQTMNPSTNDILNAINKVPAEIVIVFPNNKNIIMAAEQCVKLTTKKVIVVKTKNFPQGITAMLSYNPDESEDTIEETLTNAFSGIKTSSITYAARDSVFDGMEIKAGEYLGLSEGKILVKGKNLKKVAQTVTKKMDAKNYSFVTIYYGSDVPEENALAFRDAVAADYPKQEVTLINGGQPVYYYVISVEP